MTAFAKDRLGLVADITKIVFQNGCNLEDTQMTQLEDEFVIMLLFTGDNGGLEEQISRDCRRLEREKNISAYIRELADEISKPLEAYSTHSIFAQGVDQAGIVYKISDFLAARSVNISQLNSHKTPTPESGTPIYTVEIVIQVPTGKSLEELEQELFELGQEIHIEFNLDKE